MATPYYNAGTAPIVVQGQVVAPVINSPHHANGGNSHNTFASSGGATTLLPPSTGHVGGAGTGEWNGGEKQSRRCRDVFWALLFYAHLVAIAVATLKNTPTMAQDMAENYEAYGQGRRSLLSLGTVRWLDENQSEDNQKQEADWNDYNQDQELNIDMNTLISILCVAGLASLVLSSLALGFMMTFAKGLIKMALWFNIIVTGVVTLFALATGVIQLAVLCGLGFLFSIYYAYCVWSRIPFAASNLVTAVTAVRANMGLAFFAYTNLIVSFLWSVWWALALVATSYVMHQCVEEGNCDEASSGIIVFLFILSYYWTTQVVKNVVHVTVAGTVGTWWFTPLEASTCCSQGVRDSYMRSITTSFGSICLGSLIVAIIQAIKDLVQSARESEDSMLMCCLQFVLGCIESLVEYFNQWAFVFVGLYGYSFMEAGMNVMALFKNRGWTAIIADILVDTVLLMVSLGVGVLTGIVGVVAGAGMIQADDAMDIGGEATLAIAFIGGFLMGFVMCSTLFSVVSSAVNAVIVCYAEAPNEFQTNHPQLSAEMRASWRQAYPVEFQY